MGGEELRFTGNWFIDAGILGFVNLMGEVYGWDLEELQRRIKEEPEKMYYGYFPLAYFYNLSGKRDRKAILMATKEVEKFEGDKYSLLEFVWWNFITEVFEDKWVQSKLKQMHKKDILDRNGSPKPAFNDESYVEYIEKREKLLTEVACDNDCQNALRSVLGLRKALCENNTHKLELEQVEQLNNTKVMTKVMEILPGKCREKLQEALIVHEELKEYLTSQWTALKNVLSEEINIEGLKDKSRYFRIPIDSGFYKNFMFFNNSKGILEQLEDLKNIIEGNVEYTEYLRKIDKTLSKFLPSDSEFPNVHYTHIRVEPLLRQVPHLFIYLLNFLNAFTFVSGIGNVFFYGSTLEFTYHVNKRLKVLVAQTREKQSMFKITWQAVIDTLIEEKSKWSLENMYLIQFAKVSQQNLVNVEYIGIPKLHASIILDDKIRDALNTSLPTGDPNIWLLGEFIKQKPLYPLISKHIWNVVRKNSSPKWRTSLYALAVDAKLRSEGNSGLFGRAFLDRPKRAAVEVKDFHRDMNGVAMTIKELSPEIGGKNLIHPLFSALRRHNRNAFVNTLLKALLQAKSRDKVAIINSYLFRRVLNNDSSWEEFALALVIGLVGGGGDASSGQDIVED